MAVRQMAHEDYTVAWVCALALEAAASRAALEKTHPKLPQPTGDSNAYTLGEIADHNIVIAYLPSGVYGTTSAATVVAQMRSTFSSIRFALMVGIGGGVPSAKNDIRLGDIVVSHPTGAMGGVIQYDYGKTIASGVFQQTGMLNQPPQVLLNAIAQLQADQMLGSGQSITVVVSDILKRFMKLMHQCSRPVKEQDHLYNAEYVHPKNEDTCIKCNKEQLIHRESRQSKDPQVHYGLIASGNQVIKDSQTRDRLAKEHGVLCFEMEAAGLMNQLPCLVIRGICDYCDSHKNKQWQGYAAITAAAYAKILLLMVPMNQLLKGQRSQKACWMVPFERNMRFLGRHNEILKLKKLILSKDQTQKVAISGLGGVGKTQIALELAYRTRESDPECSIFWIPSTSMEAVEQAFMSISEQLGLQNVTSTNVKSQVNAHLSSETANPWLLIIDNADDIDMWVSFDGLSPTLKPFLPQNPHGITLFTTRNQQLASKLVGPNIINISEMDDITARDLLEASLVQKELLENENSTILLIHQLSGLPLALIQAANYINENLISLNTYLSLLNDQESGMVELLSQDFEDNWRHREQKNPVAVTWLISFNQIQRLNSLAADYLSFMSCIDPQDIPQSLLPSAGSQIKQQNALGLLKAYAFITGRADDTFFTLHRLVHLAMRNWLRNKGILGKYTAKAAQQLIEIFPSNHHKNRVLWREYLSHGQFVLESAEFQDETEERERLAYKVGQCLDSDGRAREAEILFKEILEKKRKRLEDDDPSMLSSMANLASTYWNQGRWTEVEKLDVQVMETSKTVLGPEHPDALASMANLASTYRYQGRWKEAEELEVQVMETSKQVLGLEHPDTLASMTNLASTYWNQGRWKEAEELEVQVMETSKQVLGSDHPNTLTSMANLASTYWVQGRLKEAEELEVQVTKTENQVLGPDHPDTLTSMANLASTYRDQGRWKEAEELQLRVKEKCKEIIGAEHPTTLSSMQGLVKIHQERGRWKEAEQLQWRVLNNRKQILGQEHPDTLTSMSNLALILLNQDCETEAQKLALQAMETLERLLGELHPDTMTSMCIFAFIRRHQGQLKEAEKVEVRVLMMRKQTLGPEHPDTLASMHSLALTWRSMGRNISAAVLMKSCIGLRKKVLGLDHPHTLSSIAVFTEWLC